MYKYFLFALTVILAASCSNGQPKITKTNLSALEFQESLKLDSNAQLIDVRTPEEYKAGFIDKALNIDWNGSDFDTKIETLSKDKAIYVYCLSGGRSGAAAAKMRQSGFQVYELQGGIMKWRAANLPEKKLTLSESNGMTKNAFDSLLISDKIILIDFYADWCAPCKKMKPYLEEISTEMAAKVTVIRINADENKALCKILKIEGLPVLQVYKNKIKTWENTGFIDKNEVIKHLE